MYVLRSANSERFADDLSRLQPQSVISVIVPCFEHSHVCFNLVFNNAVRGRKVVGKGG